MRTALDLLGCCTAAEGAFLHGFAGRSLAFKYRPSRQTGTSRCPRADDRRQLRILRPSTELPTMSCCEDGCQGQDTSVNDFECWRKEYKQAKNAPERYSVIKRAVWDVGHGQLRGYCDALMRETFGVERRVIQACRNFAEGDPEPRAVHGGGCWLPCLCRAAPCAQGMRRRRRCRSSTA